MDFLCIHNEHSVPSIFELNFLTSDEILLTLFLPFVEACSGLGISLISCFADWFYVEVSGVKSSKSSYRTPSTSPNILIPDIRAEEIQADWVYFSCCEMQYDAV